MKYKAIYIILTVLKVLCIIAEIVVIVLTDDFLYIYGFCAAITVIIPVREHIKQKMIDYEEKGVREYIKQKMIDYEEKGVSMNKDEMIKDIPTNIIAYDGNPKGQYLYIEQRKEIAQALYNAGYRKVADDEIVIKKSEIGLLKKTIDFLEMEKDQLNKQLEQAEQETAREILKWIDEPFTEKEIRNLIAEKYGIELGGIYEQRRND